MLGKVWESMLGCGGGREKCGKVLGELWKSVLRCRGGLREV